MIDRQKEAPPKRSRLLRVRRKRPCSRRAAEQRDEFAPPHANHGI